MLMLMEIMPMRDARGVRRYEEGQEGEEERLLTAIVVGVGSSYPNDT